MSQIVKLDEHLINQIAAGEVIENPSSVVKELLDNSIDAGAKRIHIKILQGGKEFLSIEDDGCGMTKENLELSIERHATSKISKKEDLFALTTMGFRGEALASIAAISKLEIISAKEGIANKLVIWGGKKETLEPSKRSQGTTITIQSLFFNIPVRKKFQKSTSYCTREIIQVVQQMSLAYPHLYISLETEDKTFSYMPTSSKKNRVQDVLGRHFVQDSFEFKVNDGPFQIEGIISSPSQYKTHRKSQYIFINNRPVSCPYLSVAVKEGYGTFLAEKTHPLFVLFLTLPSQDIDVNVHPQKKEVRLLDGRTLFQKINRAVFTALTKEQQEELFLEEPPVDFLESPRGDSLENTPVEITGDGELTSLDVSAKSFTFSRPYQLDLSNKNLYEKQAELAFHQQQKSFSFERKKDFSICYKKGHLMLVQESEIFSVEDGENRLVLIDLQAAFAKMLFQNQEVEKNYSGQRLFLAKTLELSQEEIYVVTLHEELLKSLGIEFRLMGENTIALDTFPSFISYEKIEGFFNDILKDLFSKGKLEESKVLKARLCSQIARRKKMFTDEQAKQIIHGLIEKKEYTFDPLGNKILTFITENQLEKLLKI